MKSYKLLSHTADVRLKVEGDTLEELFTAALEGMAEIVKKGICRKRQAPSLKQRILVSSPNITALLIDFLSEVLTLSHENKAVFCRAEFSKLATNELEAEISGLKVGEFDEDIKAVTYHEAEIKKNPQGNFETIIIFDI